MTSPVINPPPAKLEVRPIPDIGAVRLVGTSMPNGIGTLTKTDALNGTMPVRGAVNFEINDGAFIIDDSEVPFNVRISYHLSVVVDDVVIQQNLVLNPSAEIDASTWQPVGPRTLERVDGVKTVSGSAYFHVTAATDTIMASEVVAQTEPQQLLPGIYVVTGSTRLTPGQNTDNPGYTNWVPDPLLRTPDLWRQYSDDEDDARLTWLNGGGVQIENLLPYAGQTWGEVKTKYDTWQDAIDREGTWEGLMGAGEGITPPDVVLLSPILNRHGDDPVTLVVQGPTVGLLIVSVLSGDRLNPLSTQFINVGGQKQRVEIEWPDTVPSIRIGLAPARGQMQQIDRMGLFFGPIPDEDSAVVPFSGDDIGYFWTGESNRSTSARYIPETYPARWVLIDTETNTVLGGGAAATATEKFTSMTSLIAVGRTTEVAVGLQLLTVQGEPLNIRAWDFDAVRLDLDRPNYPWSLLYFDGSTATPPQAPAGAHIRWLGSAHASHSEYDGPGRLEFDTPGVTLTIATPEEHCSGAQIHLSDPVMPIFGNYYTLLEFDDLDFDGRQGEFDIIGRSAPLMNSDVRKAPASTITLLTYDKAERDRTRMLLASGRTLLLRMPPEFGDAMLYLNVKNTSEQRVFKENIRRWERRWPLQVQVVDRPAGLVDTGLTNWQTVVNKHATWREVKARYSTWLDLIMLNATLGDITVGAEGERNVRLLVHGQRGREVEPGGSWYGSGYAVGPRVRRIKDGGSGAVRL